LKLLDKEKNSVPTRYSTAGTQDSSVTKSASSVVKLW